MIDLQKYCGDDKFRPYLNRPFTVGEFSYATDGRIMVRVPRIDGWDPPGIDHAWDGPFKGLEKALFGPLAHKALPPLPKSTERECEDCEGRGKEHDCPDCECDCENCDGSGREIITPEISTTIRGGIFNLKYVALMLELPGVLVQTDRADGEAPLLFKFDGGIGAMMPRRANCERHVEIETDRAA